MASEITLSIDVPKDGDISDYELVTMIEMAGVSEEAGGWNGEVAVYEKIFPTHIHLRKSGAFGCRSGGTDATPVVTDEWTYLSPYEEITHTTTAAVSKHHREMMHHTNNKLNAKRK